MLSHTYPVGTIVSTYIRQLFRGAGERDIEMEDSYRAFAEVSKELLIARRVVQWRINYGLWTILALAAYFVGPHLESESLKWWLVGAIGAVLVFYVNNVVALASSNTKDMAIIEYWRREESATRKLKNPVFVDEFKDAKWLQRVLERGPWCLWLCRFKKGEGGIPIYRWLPHIGTTIVFAFVAGLLVFYPLQTDTNKLDQLEKENARLRQASRPVPTTQSVGAIEELKKRADIQQQVHSFYNNAVANINNLYTWLLGLATLGVGGLSIWIGLREKKRGETFKNMESSIEKLENRLRQEQVSGERAITAALLMIQAKSEAFSGRYAEALETYLLACSRGLIALEHYIAVAVV